MMTLEDVYQEQLAAGRVLLAAAETVIAGLNARIYAAPANAVPVFDGIADLHDAIGRARRAGIEPAT